VKEAKLSKAEELAKSTQCLANIKQLMLATQICMPAILMVGHPPEPSLPSPELVTFKHFEKAEKLSTC
jgi:hypothetical protein